MEQIKKGDRLAVPDATEPLVASRDEYDSRVWALTEQQYLAQNSPGTRAEKEQPYLVLPDRTLVRDFQHGFPDEKFDKK